MKTLIPAGLSALALSIAPASGAFTLIDNFEGYAAGAANGVGGWTANGDTNFVVDPSNPGNQVLSSAETGAVTTTNVYKTIPTILDGTTGTIFFRALTGNPSDFVIGVTDVAAPSNWPDFEGYMRFNNANVDVRDGGGFANAGTFTASEWYNVWLVLDHTTDTTTIYYNQGAGDATTAAASGAFRTSGNTVHDDIVGLFIRSNSPDNGGLIDDIYVDTTGANLTNPAAIPEPATSLLAVIGLAFGLRRRR